MIASELSKELSANLDAEKLQKGEEKFLEVGGQWSVVLYHSPIEESRRQK